MAGSKFKHRLCEDSSNSTAAPLSKKQKKQTQDASGYGDKAGDVQDFRAVGLLGSDNDNIHFVDVRDCGESGSAVSSVGSVPGSEDMSLSEARSKTTMRPKPTAMTKSAPRSRLISTWYKQDLSDKEDENEGVDKKDEYSDLSDEVSSEEAGSSSGRDVPDGSSCAKSSKKSKRNDPEAFSTSIFKILGTKTSSKKRADPVLARSADAHERVRQIVDEELERKARRKLREQKQRAMEKGRVRDVLVATNSTFSNINPSTGQVVKGTDWETTGEILETERRLRKVAQRGVVQLFNAFRTAQVKAAEADRVARKQGIIGMERKKEKVTEMTKKGFLDLIASGGGGLKRDPIEEA